MSPEALERELRVVAGRLSVLWCRLAVLARVAERRGLAEAWGMPTTAGWLSWRGGLGLFEAGEVVRVGRALEDLPHTAGAMAAGALSWTKARAVTRVADPATDQALAEWASGASVPTTRRITAAWARARDAGQDAERAEEARHERRGLWWRWVDARQGTRVAADTVHGDGELGGMWELHGRLDAAEGELVRTHLEGLAGRLRAEQGEPLDGCIDPAERADALVETCRRSTDHDHDNDRAPRSRPGAELVLHATWETLIGPDRTAGELSLGDPRDRAVTRAVARRLACDATVSVSVEDPEGTPVWRSRRTRTVTGRLRRAVLERDRRCAYPGCARTRLEIHHIHHWADGGPTTPDNLIALCPHHHAAHHRGVFTITPAPPGQPRFTHRNGQPLEPSPPPHTTNRPDPPIDPDTVPNHWHGQPCDLDHAITALASLTRTHTHTTTHTTRTDERGPP